MKVAPMLISLSGAQGTGKSTAARYLVKRYGFKRVSFAQPIRDGLKAMFGLEDMHFEPEYKNRPVDWIGRSPRELMQTLGTEWGRNMVNRQVWVNLAVRSIRQAQFDGFDVVVDDTRFDDELRELLSMSALPVMLTRRNAVTEHHHISDHALHAPIELFCQVHNNGTIDQFFEDIDSVLLSAMPGAEL